MAKKRDWDRDPLFTRDFENWCGSHGISAIVEHQDGVFTFSFGVYDYEYEEIEGERSYALADGYIEKRFGNDEEAIIDFMKCVARAYFPTKFQGDCEDEGGEDIT